MNKNIKKTVYELLEKEPATREDDYYLLLRVVEKKCPELAGETFWKAIQELNFNGINFKTIERARREIFKKHPELNPKRIKRIREEEREEYIVDNIRRY